jgi:uncharacterized delta-60 repeat protein
MAVDSQRRIVLAGSQCYYEDADHYKRTGCEIALTRHNPDGSTDESFGDGGTLEDGCPGSCYGEWVAIDSQDRIVLASSKGNRSTLTRYDVDGNVDGSFGDGGQVTTRFFVGSVAIDSEGRIVAAGDNGGVFGVARFESDGELDDSFGSGGITTTEFARGGGASEVALRPGGRIVAAGGSDGRFALVRYRPNGKLDHTFSRDGKLTTSFGQAITTAPPPRRLRWTPGDGWSPPAARSSSRGTRGTGDSTPRSAREARWSPRLATGTTAAPATRRSTRKTAST